MSWNNKLSGFFFSLLLITGSISCSGQNAVVQVVKKKCTYDAKYSGEKLTIHYRPDTVSLESSVEYWLEQFIILPDSVKLLIVGKLLTYENDTSLCCMNVVSRSFNGIEGCSAKPKGVDRYTVQVDALFMINRLCWPRTMELYSCTPVLYDNKLMKAINDEQEKIKYVFAEYKKWYVECKAIGRVPKYFPFNDGRYVWYGGRKSGVPKDY
jgi:hypothetical protein